MNRILCATGVLCLTGLVAVACGGDDDADFSDQNQAGSGGGGAGGTAGSPEGGNAGNAGDGDGGTADGGTSTGGSTAGGTGGGGTSNGGSGTGAMAGSDSGVPEGGATPEAGTPEGGTLAEAFAVCTSDEECVDGLVCLRSGSGQPSAQLPGYCTVPGCQGADAAVCLQPTTGNVDSTCSPVADVCTLDCSTNTECPDGMDCQTVPGNLERCVYPEVAVPPAELYGECSTVGAGCVADAGATCHPTLLYCAEACSDVGDCTAPATGTATLECSMITSLCILDCSGGAECPTGMTCEVQPGTLAELCSF